jgi:hypothetical protein
LSICEAVDVESKAAGTLSKTEHALVDLLIFNFPFDDQTYTKTLEYRAFATWDRVDALLRNTEEDGTVVEELSNVREDLPICSGDWDARVSPGMEIDVICRKWEFWEGQSCYESDDEESDWLVDDDIDKWRSVESNKKHWWFESWRRQVEQKISPREIERAHEPSRTTLVVGMLTMVLFLGGVVVTCSP